MVVCIFILILEVVIPMSKLSFLIGSLLICVIFSYKFIFVPIYSPFIYLEVDDYYSHISIDDESKGLRRMVVPYGVFHIEKLDYWLHVARMDVSIIDCDPIDGNLNEGTVYSDRLEFWLLNTQTLKVIGPLDRDQKMKYFLELGLQGSDVKIPSGYSTYSNNSDQACIN